MTQNELYYDCVKFWGRMGVKKEDNLIALAMYDVMNAFKEKTFEQFRTPTYIDKGKELIKELQNIKYDNNRGIDGWLNNYEF